MSVTRLQVTYKSPEIDDELDKKILNFFNKLDFVCIVREYMPMLFRRELHFETHGEIEVNRKIKERMDGIVKVPARS